MLRSRERGTLFRASFARLSKVVVFLALLNALPGKVYVERGTSLASLEREGGSFQGSLCSPLKNGGFFLALLNAPVESRTRRTLELEPFEINSQFRK